MVDRAAATVRRAWRRAERTAHGVEAVAYGRAQRLAHLREEEKQLDDVTLAHKVESEIFRAPDAPKGDVSVDVQHGVVNLRGEVADGEWITRLGEAAEKVDGVKGVDNRLHPPGMPAPERS